MTSRHWLANTLTRAGVARADELQVAPGASAGEAWSAAREALALSDDEVARHVASRFHLRLADVANASTTAARLVPETVVRRHNVLPLREDDREVVTATADPTDLEAEQAIGFASGRQVVFEIAAPEIIRSEIERRYAPHVAVESLVERVDPGRADAVRVVAEMAGAVARADEGESVAVVKLTNLILRAAIDYGADALEIAPADEGGAVRLLVDGVWTRYMPLPAPAMQHVIKRLRVLGNLGIANRSWSEDGGARIRIEGRTYDLRIEVSDGAARRHARVRIYDQQQRPLPADLGFGESALQMLLEVVRHDGLLVLTGPPESGVARLHYALLRQLARDGREIAFVEDRVRWDLHGVEQVPTSIAGRAAALDGVARRNFDVIGVESAATPEAAGALAAARRPGRLLLARVTAPDAATALRTLRAAAGSVDPCTFISVRRPRRPCGACGGASCDRCLRTGFRGSAPIIAITTGANAGDDAALLEQAGAELVARGTTTADELARALGRDDRPARESRAATVLVADDDPLIRLLARTVLEADGLVTVDAEDGVDALEKLAREPRIALVVLDLDMPRLDGHGVLARLRADVRTAGLPVVVLTASTSPADETRALERGADDYIRKPIDPPRFQARVRAVLRRKLG